MSCSWHALDALQYACAACWVAENCVPRSSHKNNSTGGNHGFLVDCLTVSGIVRHSMHQLMHDRQNHLDATTRPEG